MDTRRDSASAVAPVTRRAEASAAGRREEQHVFEQYCAVPCWRAEVMEARRLQAAVEAWQRSCALAVRVLYVQLYSRPQARKTKARSDVLCCGRM